MYSLVVLSRYVLLNNNTPTTNYNKTSTKTMANAEFLPVEDDETMYQVSDAPKTSAETAIDGLLDALNDTTDNTVVSLYRQSGNGKQAQIFLESMAPDKYTPDDLLMHIRSTYGSGDYRIHVRAGGKLKANKHVSIECPKIVPRETGGESPALLQALSSMNEQINRQNQIIQHMTENNRGPDKQEFLKEMMMYKELFGGQQSKPQGIQDILSTVDSLKSLGINVGGINTEPKEEGFSDILDRATPILAALLQNNNQQPRPQQPPQQQYKPNPQQRPQPQQQPEKDDVNLKLKMGIATLVRAAAKGSPTDFYADFVADNVPEGTIKEFMTHPQAIEKLTQLDKRVNDHRAWFVDVGEHLKGMFGDKTSKYAAQYSDDDLQGEAVVVDNEAQSSTTDTNNGDLSTGDVS